MAILTSSKVILKTVPETESFIMIKRSTHQEGIKVHNIWAHMSRVSEQMKQNLANILQIKPQIKLEILAFSFQSLIEQIYYKNSMGIADLGNIIKFI